MEIKKFIVLQDLEVYQLARKLSVCGWAVYCAIDWDTKKILGHQFISSTDSVGANITEGYFRFHYLDKIKFYYNARASLGECWQYWLPLLLERNKISDAQYETFNSIAGMLSRKLNNFIKSHYETKSRQP